jgi:hypothetical protein
MPCRVTAAVLLLAGLLASSAAEANVLCTWFGRCLYESPGFHITVVDKETGQPLPDVHALAEWVQHGSHGRAGPLMVQDAVSDAKGVLTFPPWGPVKGYRLGLALNLDPAITLFKAGYRTLLIQNAYPSDTTETTRVRRFGQDGQTFPLERFVGGVRNLIEDLDKAAFTSVAGPKSDEQLLQFREPYLNRRRQVWDQLKSIPSADRDLENRRRSFEQNLQYLERLRQ